MVTQRSPDSGLLRAYAPELGLVQRLADALLIAATHLVAQALVEDFSFRTDQWVATGVAVAAFYVIGQTNGLYRTWRGARSTQEVFQTLLTWGTAVPVLLFLAFATKRTADFSRLVTTSWFVVTPVVLAAWRIMVRAILTDLRRRGYNTRSVAIAGATLVGARVARTIELSPSLGYRLLGVYDDRHGRRHDIPEGTTDFVGSLDKLVEDARAGRVDVVYIALPLRAERRITDLIAKLADTTITVYVVPEFHAYDLLHARWSALGDIQIVSIFDSPFNGLGGWLKRVEDLVLGSAILALISIPMLIIAIAVKLDSKGPVFFRQRRYGLNGKPIGVLKFRTMTVMEDGASVQQAGKNDTRVTKLGKFLRRSSLDELPQFINVVLGDMSIVGPRPHAVAHNELYRARIHGYMLRHKVKPGITGWAQVNGWRGETDTLEKMERRIEHDLFYIHNWRLAWDLQIIWLTVFGSSVRNNAY